MLQYKLSLYGITLYKQNESYSSQTSPLSSDVSKASARRANRRHRGLYVDGEHSWNADTVGAYNILRLYLSGQNKSISLNPFNIGSPDIIKVAV